ncbi:MAG: helix-turn-helix domain-containing protein [Deltaproteobacteria bacterium]|nr:helix-turn-helix domain-containing protein [Deltaproteobacteria bacterium]
MEASLSNNLRRLRDARKLSQADVAERAKLSRVAYGNIESGTAQPKVETLLRISEVLGVKLQELLTPTRALKAVRFRALKRMTSREQVLVSVGRRLEDYAELEQMLNDRAEFRLEKLVRDLAKMRPSADRARAAAERARHALGLGPDASIRDICGLLDERGGVKVLPMRLASDAFFGLSVAKEDGGPAVVVNVWDRISVERWIFTAAHEFGHLLLHLGAYDVAKTEESKEEEDEANRFASHFLMPPDVFAREWNEARGLGLVDRVLKVKRIFRVSYRTVLYRLSEQKAHGKSIWQQFQFAYKARFGQSLLKSDEPQGLPPEDFNAAMVEARAADEPKRLSPDDFVEDRLSGLVRTALEKELISVGRAAEILDLDLKTMRAVISTWVE